MRNTEVVRAPWTGSTVAYDEAIEELTEAQYDANRCCLDSREYKAALRRVRAARKRLGEAIEEMVEWSNSRAYHHMHVTRRPDPRPAAPQRQEGERAC